MTRLCNLCKTYFDDSKMTETEHMIQDVKRLYIRKSEIREKIKEFDHNANDDWITISTLRTILKQLLE